MWKTIQTLKQYSQNEDHQHHEWQQKSWISFQGHLDAQDKQLNIWVNMEDSPKFLKNSKLECPDIRIRLPRLKWPNSWSNLEDPIVPLERNPCGSFWQDCCGAIRENYFGKSSYLGVLNLAQCKKRLFLTVCADDAKLVGKSSIKEVDLGEPTSFFDHVYLGCTQRQCEISKDIVDSYRITFESRISAVREEKLPFPQNLRFSSWSYDMQGHVKKCVEQYCELANKTTQQLYKVSTPCIDDHHFKEEELNSVGELSKVCSQIVLKCDLWDLIVAVLGNTNSVITNRETCYWTNVKFVQHFTQFKNESNLTEWSMIWTMLIYSFRTFCCMWLKTTRQWSRWLLKDEVQWWDSVPEPQSRVSLDVE